MEKHRRDYVSHLLREPLEIIQEHLGRTRPDVEDAATVIQTKISGRKIQNRTMSLDSEPAPDFMHLALVLSHWINTE